MYIDYYSVVDSKDFRGTVTLPQDKLKVLFQKYDHEKDTYIKLVVGMAPGGWIRVWFTTLHQQIEVAKTQLKGYKNDKVGIGLKTKDFETWGNTFVYWQHHGIPYEAWAENEKEYDLYFDFSEPNHQEVRFSYISNDGTYEQGVGIGFEKMLHQKLPVDITFGWIGRANVAYSGRIVMPKTLKNYLQGNKSITLRLEIENDLQHAILYMVSGDKNVKLSRFMGKPIREEEDEKREYEYSKEVEYFIP